MNQAKKLMRSRDHRVIAGVCGGIAEYFEIDPTIVRIAAAALVLTSGAGLLAYLFGWLVLPDETGNTGLDDVLRKAPKPSGPTDSFRSEN